MTQHNLHRVSYLYGYVLRVTSIYKYRDFETFGRDNIESWALLLPNGEVDD